MAATCSPTIRPAAGVDAVIATRRAAAAATIYMNIALANRAVLAMPIVLLAGLARARLELMQGFNIEGGALCDPCAPTVGRRQRPIGANNVANLYSIYAGPTLTKRHRQPRLRAGYRFGC